MILAEGQATLVMGPRPVSRGRLFGRRPADVPYRASMGPRPVCRGRPLRGRRGRAERGCFNGTTAGEPWKTILQGDGPYPTKLLQWGHGEGAVENEDTEG